jgi:hypothetical protein
MTYSMWPWRMITMLSPDFFGNPARGDYWGYATYWEDHVYMGVIPILLAFSSILVLIRGLKPARRNNTWLLLSFSWLTVLASILLALGTNTPLFPFLYKNIPTFNMFQAPARYLLWTAAVLPILTSVGIQNWGCPQGKKLYWFRLATAGAFAVTLGAGLAWYFIDTINLTFIRSAALTGIWALSFGLFTLSMPLANTPKRKKIWESAVITACLLDLLLASWPMMPSTAVHIFSASANTVEQINDGKRVYLSPEDEYDLKFSRFFQFENFQPDVDWAGLAATLIPNMNLIQGAASANNFDPLVSERYQRWMKEASLLPDDARRGWLSFSGVGWLEEVDENSQSGVRYAPIQGANDWHWYSCFQAAPDELAAWKLIKAEMQRPPLEDRSVILEGSPSLPSLMKAEHCSSIEPEIKKISEKPGSLEFAITTAEPGMLQVMQSWYPGWTAEVDGKDTHIFPADSFFQAVPVDAGTHTVKFFYRPSGFDFIGMLSILVLLCVLFRLFRK